MSHNQLKKFSQNHQAFSVPYADSEGFITDWIQNDPFIKSLQLQNEFIGTVSTCPEGEEQEILTQYVVDQKGREPRNGDLVNIQDRGEQWFFNGQQWIFYSDYLLKDASKTTKGIVQIGDGINVTDGLISVDMSILTPSKNIISDTTSTTATINNVVANVDYTFSKPLTSLTLGTIAKSQYQTDIYFTTGDTFTFSAPNLTEWFFESNPPTFMTNKSYKISISQGKGTISYIGERVYPLNKIMVTNPQLTPADGKATWTITNTLKTADVFIRLVEVATGETVAMDSSSTNSSITISFNAESTVAAGTYKAVILG